MAENKNGKTIGLLALASELGLPLDVQLRELLPVARAVHDLRKGENKPVSRSSLLYAASLVEPKVAEALVEAGLKRSAWEPHLDVEGFDVEEHRPPPWTDDERPPELEDLFEVNADSMTPSLEAYRAAFPGDAASGDESGEATPPRALDTLGLAYGIVAAAADGSAPGLGKEKEAGLDPSRAAALLDERTLFLHHARREELDRFSMSWVAAEAVRRTEELIDQRVGARVPLTTSLLLLGFAFAGREESDHHAAWFLHGFFSERAAEDTEVDTRIDEWIAWYRDRIPDWLISAPDSPPLISRYVLETFESARKIAIAVGRNETIHGRHLLGALLAEAVTAAREPGRRSGVRDLLDHLEIDVVRLVEAFLDYLRLHAPATGGDNLAAWRLVFDPVERIQLGMPSFDAEGFEGPDLLNITRDVHAFANLLAAESLAPPLAIGLFGDWGSGKSFFMQKLRRRIDDLAAAADRRGRGKTAFLSNVVQIEFNAWHYIDTNLWASLVTHTFERLHRHFVPRRDEERRQWEQLLEKLDQAIDLRSDAEENLAVARHELENAEKRRKEERLNLGEAVREVWEALKKDDALGKDLERMEEVLGVDALREVREDLVLLRGQTRELVGRLPVFRDTVLRGLGSLRTLGWAGVAVAFAVLIAVLLPLAGGEALDRVAARIAEVVAVIGGAGTWIGTAFRRASEAMGAVERVEKGVHEALRNVDARKLAVLREAEHQVAVADETVAARRRQVAELRQQIESLRPAQRLTNFLAERASSTDYRKHLGLAALIRRDFERLHGLMRPKSFVIPAVNADALGRGEIPDELRREVRRHDVDFRRDDETSSDEAAGQAPEVPRPTIKAREQGWTIEDPANSRTLEIERAGQELRCTLRWDVPRIERIILYIDDLDRCPPPRVVKVLQAVHLLLAFPLFVVVVGVDARWVSRSLALRFKDLWRHVDVGNGGGDPDDTAATPQDYLEKIFQVPFWLEPMNEDATRDYIDGLVAGSLVGTGDGGRDENDREGKDETDRKRIDGTQDEGKVEADRDEKDETDREGKVETQGKDEVATPGKEGTGDGNVLETATAGSPPPPGGGAPPLRTTGGTGDGTGPGDEELNPSSLVLQNEEWLYMRGLAPLIGRSPRAVKRYVNVYRLIRSGISEGRVPAFLGTADSPGAYRAVLFLLGVVVGAPTLAESFFSELRDGDEDRSLEDLLAAVRGRVAGAAEAECDQLRKLLNGASGDLRHGDLRHGLRVKDMAEYRRQVGRFSFRVGRV